MPQKNVQEIPRSDPSVPVSKSTKYDHMNQTLYMYSAGYSANQLQLGYISPSAEPDMFPQKIAQSEQMSTTTESGSTLVLETEANVDESANFETCSEIVDSEHIVHEALIIDSDSDGDGNFSSDDGSDSVSSEFLSESEDSDIDVLKSHLTHLKKHTMIVPKEHHSQLKGKHVLLFFHYYKTLYHYKSGKRCH